MGTEDRRLGIGESTPSERADGLEAFSDVSCEPADDSGEPPNDLEARGIDPEEPAGDSEACANGLEAFSDVSCEPVDDSGEPSNDLDVREIGPEEPADDAEARADSFVESMSTSEERGPLPTAAEEHALGVTDIRKRFGRKEVVRGISFTMRNGEIVGLLGPNGAGKTTTFYMIVGFHKPNAGCVHMNGVSINGLPMYRRARMGVAYLPQEPSIFRKLTVEQNIWAILETRRDIDRAMKKERLEQLLREFGMDGKRKQLGLTLSGGERRRTEIARALATEPKFLLLDEPFAGIDPLAVYEIKQIIRKLAGKGIGILITDHNVRDTLEITTEAYIIAEGCIVARGDRNAILANEMVREVYLGSEFAM